MTESARPSPPDPFAAARLGPVSLRNRVLKAATFEGMSPRNTVSDSLIEFHRRIAAGGTAMTTVSYIAVSRDGMGAPAEIFIHDAAADGLAEIAEVVHAAGARISAQLGHAGAVGMVRGKRVLGPSKARTLAGRSLLRDYPFEEAYFLPLARKFRSALAMPLILLGGINEVATIRQAMAEGFDFVAIGRALLRDPDLVARLSDGTAEAGTCVHCNKCMVSIYSGTRCVLDHPEPPSIS